MLKSFLNFYLFPVEEGKGIKLSEKKPQTSKDKELANKKFK